MQCAPAPLTYRASMSAARLAHASERNDVCHDDACTSCRLKTVSANDALHQLASSCSSSRRMRRGGGALSCLRSSSVCSSYSSASSSLPPSLSTSSEKMSIAVIPSKRALSSVSTPACTLRMHETPL